MAVNSLKGRTALITGAGKRIGRAVAMALSGEGANIVIHYNRSEAEAAALAGELRACGVEAWLVKADLERPDERSTLVERAAKAAGKIDIIVNNASVFPPSTLSDLSFEDLLSSMTVNAWVPFSLSRDLLRLSKKGDVINILDTRLADYDWKHVAYILSKHVLSVLTKMTAVEYAPDVRINAVAPGLILPPPGEDESYIEGLTHTVPLKRHGDPEDVASAVIFLLKNDFLTGTVIPVDGGRHLKEGR
ncbi:MAG: SDR family oxidoreductase [Deltaproteobacteria bacterium]|nr:SDR family oxidoreductase [Deltaproteobacteria bacterium]